MKRKLLLCILVYTLTSIWWGPAVEAAFHLEREPGYEAQEGISAPSNPYVLHDHYDLYSFATVRPKLLAEARPVFFPKPKPKVAPAAPSYAGDPFDCVFMKESGNRPLPCAPHCGRGQWLPSTWRAAGGTKYASLPQYATEAQEKEIARSWLAKTNWGQWPNTSRACGLR